MDAYGPFAASAVSHKLFKRTCRHANMVITAIADVGSVGKSYIDEIWYLGLGRSRLSDHVQEPRFRMGRIVSPSF